MRPPDRGFSVGGSIRLQLDTWPDRSAHYLGGALARKRHRAHDDVAFAKQCVHLIGAFRSAVQYAYSWIHGPIDRRITSGEHWLARGIVLTMTLHLRNSAST